MTPKIIASSGLFEPRVKHVREERGFGVNEGKVLTQEANRLPADKLMKQDAVPSLPNVAPVVRVEDVQPVTRKRGIKEIVEELRASIQSYQQNEQDVQLIDKDTNKVINNWTVRIVFQEEL